MEWCIGRAKTHVDACVFHTRCSISQLIAAPLSCAASPVACSAILLPSCCCCWCRLSSLCLVVTPLFLANNASSHTQIGQTDRQTDRRRQQVAQNARERGRVGVERQRQAVSLWRVNQRRAVPASNQVQDIKQQQLAFPLDATKTRTPLADSTSPNTLLSPYTISTHHWLPLHAQNLK